MIKNTVPFFELFVVFAAGFVVGFFLNLAIRYDNELAAKVELYHCKSKLNDTLDELVKEKKAREKSVDQAIEIAKDYNELLNRIEFPEGLQSNRGKND